MLVTRLILILLVLLVTAVVADQRKLFLKFTVTPRHQEQGGETS
jgi:hypothetical protein